MLGVLEYASLPTERRSSRPLSLDRLPTTRLLRAMARQDRAVPRAVEAAIPSITQAVDRIVAALQAGGRLFFIGAGTSGRLGVIEAAECPPTFNTPPGMVQAIMAGGRGAVFASKEGAEDDGGAARRTIRRRARAGDVVVGIAASGVTPFVRAGLQAAKSIGAATVLLTCHAGLAQPPGIDVLIALSLPAEIIAGSTRLKAGTATKLALNMITIGSMVRLGKVYDQWMVDLRPTSKKLRARALRIIQEVGGVPPARAAAVLRRARGDVKVAVVMAALRVNVDAAAALLARHAGRLRPLLSQQRRTPRT